MNSRILNTEVQLFLVQNLDADLDRIVLKGSPFEGITGKELAQQIQSRRKCRTKLPLWFSTEGILFPPALNIEQSSSEKAAEYKASLIEGQKIADLSGGLGVDTLFFSRRFEQVWHIEIDQNLHEIARHNLKKLHADRVMCINDEAIAFLESSNEKFDWIYVDPSRRDEHKKKVFRLEDCSPDLVENLDVILSRCDNLLIKLAPFLDISDALKQLKKVEEVQVVAIDNEVKELLFKIGNDVSDEPRISAVNLLKNRIDKITGTSLLDFEIPYGPVKKYLYEPNAAIRKAGLYPALAKQYDLIKIHPNSHLFTSDALINFPGRTFLVEKQMKYSPRKIKKELNLDRAHVTTRNFHDSVALIRKRTGIMEGGDTYLFFTTDYRGKSTVMVCKKADAS